jgi:aminopeptidase N
MHRNAPGFSVLASLIVVLPILSSSTIAQPPTPGNASPFTRRPFAKAGAPRQVERVRTFDVRHIKGELILDTTKSEIRGKVTHTIAPLHPGLDSLTLDCGADLKVSAVEIGFTDCTYSQKGDELLITLDEPYGPDKTFELSVSYAGSPEKGIRFVKPDADHPDRAVCVWTVGEPEDARFWIPCFDYPNERSTSEMIVTVDKPLSVVSNGTLESTTENEDGTSTYHWKMDSQLTTYLLSVVAADFAVYHDKLGNLPVDYYVLKEVDEATARRTMGKTPRMIDFFNQKIGTPYAYPKYATVCVPEFGGGMEHTSATTMTDSILVDPIQFLERDSDSIVAHELAHQWFGDLLTCRDWSNLWLNEGFASYFDVLFTEYDKGEDAFRLAVAGDLRSYLGSDSQYRRPIVETRFGDPWQMFDGVTYAKGACVLHALRGLVGDEAWWRGIKLYVATNKDKNVATDDFRKAMEKASGRDLGWFFDQWVFHGGHPELTARWHYEDDDKTLRLKVDQTQPTDETTPLFRLPTTVEIGDESSLRSVPIVIDARTQEFVIPSPRKPKMVRIDPKGWFPKVLTFEKPVEEWIYQLGHSGDVLGRIEAANVLAEKHKDDKLASEALSKAWPFEKDPGARSRIVELLGTFGEPCRSAILDAAKDTDARVRVEAIRGLAKLKFDASTESILRATWANKAEAYGARSGAFQGLVKAKVKDADELIASALKEPSNRHRFAVAALQTILNEPGQKAREAAVLYSRPGQPSSLRTAAIQALARQAKEDPQAEKLLVALVDDPQPNVRNNAMFNILSGGFTSALPKIEQQLPKVQGRMRQALEAQIEGLKNSKKPPTPGPDPSVKEAADLERQALDLELQVKELRNRAEALKLKAERAKLAAPKPAN